MSSRQEIKFQEFQQAVHTIAQVGLDTPLTDDLYTTLRARAKSVLFSDPDARPMLITEITIMAGMPNNLRTRCLGEIEQAVCDLELINGLDPGAKELFTEMIGW